MIINSSLCQAASSNSHPQNNQNLTENFFLRNFLEMQKATVAQQQNTNNFGNAQELIAMNHLQHFDDFSQRNMLASLGREDMRPPAALDYDILRAIKAKEQKFCQDIFEKFLHEVDRNNVQSTNVTSLLNNNDVVMHRTFNNSHCAANQKDASRQLSTFTADNKNNNFESLLNHCNRNLQQLPLANSNKLSVSSPPLSMPSFASSPSSSTSPPSLEATGEESLGSVFENGTLPASPSSNSSYSNSMSDEIEDHRPYCCTICDKRFRFKSNLFEHKSLHAKAHAFHCPFCGKTCRLKGNLKKHLQVHVNTVEDLEKLWKKRFSRSSGRPRKDTPQKPLPAVGDDLGLVPINKTKPFMATWVFSPKGTTAPSTCVHADDVKPTLKVENDVRNSFKIENLL